MGLFLKELKSDCFLKELGQTCKKQNIWTELQFFKSIWTKMQNNEIG